jgi:hypothetical protein
MGDSPVENSVDDLESEMTEDGKTPVLLFTKHRKQIHSTLNKECIGCSKRLHFGIFIK